jgi:hypothetical protein
VQSAKAADGTDTKPTKAQRSFHSSWRSTEGSAYIGQGCTHDSRESSRERVDIRSARRDDRMLEEESNHPVLSEARMATEEGRLAQIMRSEAERSL